MTILPFLSSQRLVQPVEESLFLRLDRGAQALRQLFEELALFLRQLGGHGHVDDDELIAAILPADIGNTLASDRENFSGLGSGGYFKHVGTIQRGDFNFRAERSLGNIDIQVEDDIVLTALEELVRPHVEDEEQAAVRSAEDARTSFACQTDLRACIHTGGNLHGLLDRLAFQSVAMTGLAGRRDRFTAAVTGGTGRRLDHLPQERLAHLADLTLPVTGGAFDR